MDHYAIAAWALQVTGFLLVFFHDPPLDRPAGLQVSCGHYPGLTEYLKTRRNLPPELRKEYSRVIRRRYLKQLGFLLLLTGFAVQFQLLIAH